MSLGSDYTEWRGTVDMTIRDLKKDMEKLLKGTKEMKGIKAEITILKSTINGMQLSQEALAGAQENILNDLESTSEGGGSSFNADAIINAIKGVEDAIRKAEGTRPSMREPEEATPRDRPEYKQPREPSEDERSSDKEEPMVVDIDVDDIAWKIRGGHEARPSDFFAYAFIFTSKGSDEVHDDAKEVYELLQRYGSIETADGFVVNLGGTGKSLLNRTPAKKRK